MRRLQALKKAEKALASQESLNMIKYIFGLEI
jgi:hypothetical protein